MLPPAVQPPAKNEDPTMAAGSIGLYDLRPEGVPKRSKYPKAERIPRITLTIPWLLQFWGYCLGQGSSSSYTSPSWGSTVTHKKCKYQNMEHLEHTIQAPLARSSDNFGTLKIGSVWPATQNYKRDRGPTD